MILNLDNIGGIRFVPYGETARRLYGPSHDGLVLKKTLEEETYEGRRPVAYARVYLGGADYAGRTTRIMMPGASEAGKPILDVDGRIYLDGINILNATGTESFSSGGYLGTVRNSFLFRCWTRTESEVIASETIEFDQLGVIPAAYSGGLRVTNLSTPPASLRDHGATGSRGTNRQGYETAFHANGTPFDILNFRVENYFPAGTHCDLNCRVGAVIEHYMSWRIYQQSNPPD